MKFLLVYTEITKSIVKVAVRVNEKICSNGRCRQQSKAASHSCTQVACSLCTNKAEISKCVIKYICQSLYVTHLKQIKIICICKTLQTYNLSYTEKNLQKKLPYLPGIARQTLFLFFFFFFLGIPFKTKHTLSRTNTPPAEPPFGFKLFSRQTLKVSLIYSRFYYFHLTLKIHATLS